MLAFKAKDMPENYPMCFDTDVEPRTFCSIFGKLRTQTFSCRFYI